MGKPSVITAVGGIPEVVKHKVNGYLVAPDAPEQLAEGLLLMMNDPNLRRAISHEAQSTYFNRFRPHVMTTKLEEQ